MDLEMGDVEGVIGDFLECGSGGRRNGWVNQKELLCQIHGQEGETPTRERKSLSGFRRPLHAKNRS
ncbi:hypothetical protein [Rubritalea tangerina]|uniref:hypothetical protein n=1 Tax=Rubritalea tangerina TaxID=430798 RepID=UPI00361859F5